MQYLTNKHNLVSSENYNVIGGLEKPLIYNNETTITTKLLSKLYQCDEQQILQNFNNNKDKFKENIHYIKLEGSNLKDFKNYFEDFETVIGYGLRTSKLYLWTKRGASRHSKMLGTDKAWDMFDLLEENYFNPKIQNLTLKEELQLKLFSNNLAEVAAAHKQLLELETKPLLDKIEKDEPKVEIYEDFLNADGTYTVTQICKSLNVKRTDVYRMLREKELVYKNKTEATKKGIDKGYFKQVIKCGYSTMVVTSKGLEYIKSII